MVQTNEWKRCNGCKRLIPYSATHYVCSVSTCTRKRTGFVFCSVECWETHVPMMRHREAWAVEETAPSEEEWARILAGDAEPAASVERATSDKGASDRPAASRRRVVTTKAEEVPPGAPEDVLVIASRLKHYIRTVHGLSTSDAVLDLLSGHLRRLCNRAAEQAKQAERKTVLDRDFDFLR